MIKIEQIKVGGDRNFAYIVYDELTLETAIIDPSYSPKTLYKFVKDNKLKLKYIFNTHLHFDHTNGNDEIESLTQLSVINKTNYSSKQYNLGEYELSLIETPGHTPDSICIYVGNYLFTGDTLFVGKVGGTSTEEQAIEEYNSLHFKILTLPNDVVVCPGHDYGLKPLSTIGDEKKTNPFLIQPNYEAFLYLKNNWADYKIKHGIK